MKKKLASILSFLIIAAVGIGILYILFNNAIHFFTIQRNTIGTILEKIQNPKHISNNYLAKYEMYDSELDETFTVAEIYRLDDNLYVDGYNDIGNIVEKTYTDFSSNTQVTVNIDNNTVSIDDIFFDYCYDNFSIYFDTYIRKHAANENLYNYEYHGIEFYEDTRCFLISFTSYYEDHNEVDYYYVDHETGCIVCREEYTVRDDVEVLKTREKLTYTYDCLSKEDLKTYSEEDYKSFRIINNKESK